MTLFRIACIVGLLAGPSGCAFATGGLLGDGPFIDLPRLNACLKGHVVDYTANHGKDNRICSDALSLKRDVYVYVPPGFDPKQAYPMVMWFHGFAQDEKAFLELIPRFDKAMIDGILPKCILVAPDGSPNGRASYFDAGSLYLNSPLGKFEDYVMIDVWNFVHKHYPIRKEREAHVLAGASMGGFGAYNLAIKHRERVGMAIGIMPPLNLRYADCRGNQRTDFDPYCFGTAERYRPMAPLARFYGGLITVRQRRIVAPVFGEGPDVIQRVARENPAEMLEAYGVKPGEIQMFAAYGELDEFNFDAQTESFAFIAAKRGIEVHLVKAPGGRHNRETAFRFLDPLADWARPKLEKYAPK